MTEYETIAVSAQDRVGFIQLNRPKALNALNSTMAREVVSAASAFDEDPSIGAILITGSARAFAAGADIKELADQSFIDIYMYDLLAPWGSLARVRKPLVAAVAGFALGGGCELAMMCDIVIAADTAKFGLPELSLGVIPGLGGTQRLPRAVGKYKAADLVLTGRTLSADEAERAGLVSRVVPEADLLTEATDVAVIIASKSLPAVLLAKQALQAAQETSLAEGMRAEKQAFSATFALEDRAEGMAAFLEKRQARFAHR